MDATCAIPARGARSSCSLYNTYYQRTYRRFGNIAVFNHAQLLLDVVVVTLLVYYSGGVYSWFDAMYLLFILEAALILPTAAEVWVVARGVRRRRTAWCWAPSYLGWLPARGDAVRRRTTSHDNGTLRAVRYLWDDRRCSAARRPWHAR